MAFSLKDIIFKLFGRRYKRTDSNKDAFGKGTYERYHESIGEDFDENELLLIDNLVANLVDPQTAFDRFIPSLEQMVGMDLPLLGDDIDKRRKLIQFANSLYNLKGTPRLIRIMIKWLGFDTVDIQEFFNNSSFDSDTTFDSNSRPTFDNFCDPCFDYSIFLTGTVVIDQGILQSIFNMLKFNEPINGTLRTVVYNGDFLVQEIISVEVLPNGDLQYDNEFDPGLVLRIAGPGDPDGDEGDLIIEGPNAANYSINAQGDLIYTIGSFFFNQALKLNAGSQHIVYSNIVAYNFGGADFMFNFWVQVNDLGSTQEIISKLSASVGWRIYYDSNEIIIDTYNSASNKNIVSSESVIVSSTSWYMVSVNVSTEDANNYKMWVNRVAQTTSVDLNDQDGSGDNDLDTATDLLIGKESANFGLITMDEFILAGGGLTQSLAEGLYNGGDGEDPIIVGIPDIRLRSNFDELLGTVVFDQTDNDNDGTLTNAPGDTTNRVLH